MMKTKQLALPIAFLLGVTSCASNEIGNSKDVAQDKIYQQYSINYEEGNENADFRAQFRFAGRNGTTLVLSEPSKIVFGQTTIKVDSSGGSGAYYKTSIPFNTAAASHNFIFTDYNGKNYENSFLLNHFKLSNLPTTASKSKPLSVAYSFEPAYQLQGDDYIELETVNNDSSFNITVNKSDKPGIINIPLSCLKKQKGKQLELQASLSRKQSLKQAASEAGELRIRYTLKSVKIGLSD